MLTSMISALLKIIDGITVWFSNSRKTSSIFLNTVETILSKLFKDWYLFIPYREQRCWKKSSVSTVHSHEKSPQWNSGLPVRPKTNITHFIQQRFDTLYFLYENGDINANEFSEELSYSVAKNTFS